MSAPCRTSLEFAFTARSPWWRAALQWAQLEGRDVPVCCAGCRAAAQLIAQLGLEDFYRFRTASSLTPQPVERGVAALR